MKIYLELGYVGGGLEELDLYDICLSVVVDRVNLNGLSVKSHQRTVAQPQVTVVANNQMTG